MKRIFLAVAMVFVTTSFVFGQMNKDEQAVRQLFDELNAALQRSDTAALERIYADDYTLVDPSGAVTTKAQRIAAIKSGDLKYDSFKREIESIRKYGDTAVASMRVTYKGWNKGQEIGGSFRTTSTLVKTNGRWRVVAAQSTRDEPPADEKALNQFMDNYLAALMKNSADAVEPFVGGQYIRVGPDGSTLNKEQALAALRSGDLKYDSVVSDERTWRTFGNETAIVTSRATLKASHKGQDVSGTYRATTVLRRAGIDRWVVVSTHLSRIDGK